MKTHQEFRNFEVDRRNAFCFSCGQIVDPLELENKYLGRHQGLAYSTVAYMRWGFLWVILDAYCDANVTAKNHA